MRPKVPQQLWACVPEEIVTLLRDKPPEWLTQRAGPRAGGAWGRGFAAPFPTTS